MDTLHRVSLALSTFCFGYPFVDGVVLDGRRPALPLLRERHEPRHDDPPPLRDIPAGVDPRALLQREGQRRGDVRRARRRSTIRTSRSSRSTTARATTRAEILDELAQRIPQLRVVHLARNRGKARALNVGALAARGTRCCVGIDGDALLDRHALTLVRAPLPVRRRRSARSPATRASATARPLLGRLQVGEFSSIVGLIKRAQTVYGRLFTVSGVVCAFRKRALHDAGWWSPAHADRGRGHHLAHPDRRLAGRLRAQGAVLDPDARDTRGLWRQRLRWAEGGTQHAGRRPGAMSCAALWRLLPIWTQLHGERGRGRTPC